MSVDISVIVPAYNEHESLPELMAWIHRVMAEHKFRYETIVIDDGSDDGTWKVIQALSEEYVQVKGIKFRRNYGKSAALNTGFSYAVGEVVITMDADLQDSPEEIPDLYAMIKKDGYDLVSGWKKTRHDPIGKTIPSKFFNRVTRWVSGIELHDFNCGLKAYSNEVVKSIEVYGEMHRYIPVIAKWAGFSKIGEKVVQHQARKHGVSKFGMNRFIRGFLDLMSLTFVGKFAKRPMHFFGSMGFLFFFTGFLMLVYLSVEKFYHKVGGINERPLFFFGILLLIIGSQLFLSGFLAELISRNSPRRNSYNIREVTSNISMQSGESIGEKTIENKNL